MGVKIEKREFYTLVSVVQESLDANIATDLKSEFILRSKEGERNFLLDMAKCNSCDESGLTALTTGYRLSNEMNGAFVISGVNPQVEKIVELAQIHYFMTITKTREDAEKVIEKLVRMN